jgi:hypothetical protein
MKQSLFNLGLILTLTVLFSSCGSISITQKRYSNGLNIDWFTAKDKKQDVHNQTPKRKAKTIPSNALAKNTETNERNLVEDNLTSYFNLTENSLNIVEESIINNNVVSYKARGKKGALKQLKNANYEELSIAENTTKSDVKKLIKGIKQTKAVPNKTNDTPFIILFILALFPVLTLLAIYLYYEEINFHFWLNLLLLLIGGGLFVSIGFIGISFAVIHALLVVFGIF